MQSPSILSDDRCSDPNRPSKLIVEVGPELKEFRDLLNDLSLPTIDFDAVLEQVVDAVRHDPSANAELYELPQTFLTTDLMVSRATFATYPNSEHYLGDQWEDVLGLEMVAVRAKAIGQRIVSTFRQLKLFEGEYLKFEYDGTLDDKTLVLRTRR